MGHKGTHHFPSVQPAGADNMTQFCFIDANGWDPLTGPPSHWSPISMVPHLNGPPSHWSHISLVPQCDPDYQCDYTVLIGPPSHWSPSLTLSTLFS